MKILTLLNTNKYKLLAILLATLCIYLFFQGLKKDHSLDTYKLQQRLLEEKRQEITKTREAYQSVIDMQEKKILVLQLRDSVLAVHAAEIQTKIKYIESSSYVKEKLQPVTNYTDADLQQYFNNLQPMQEPTDY